MRKDLAEYEQDITGLSNALIAAKREQVKDAEALRVSALTNAAVASKNAGMNR
jgi:hypothetical protein